MEIFTKFNLDTRISCSILYVLDEHFLFIHMSNIHNSFLYLIKISIISYPYLKWNASIWLVSSVIIVINYLFHIFIHVNHHAIMQLVRYCSSNCVTIILYNIQQSLFKISTNSTASISEFHSLNNYVQIQIV